jgi:hypothetical protein
MQQDWFDNRGKIERAVGDILRSTIHTNGPITKGNYTVACKRIYQQLKEERRKWKESNEPAMEGSVRN